MSKHRAPDVPDGKAGLVSLMDLVVSALVVAAVAFGLPFVTEYVVRQRAINRLCSAFRFFRDPRPELFWGSHQRAIGLIRFGRRRYLWTLRDAVVHLWVKQLGDTRTAAINIGEPPVPLVRFRAEFRTIVNYALAYEHVAGLARCLAPYSLESRRLAIWLLGRSAHPFATSLVVPWMRDNDASVRRAAARSLRRLTAFADLHAFENDPDPQVRQIAMDPRSGRRAFSTRLQSFAARARHEIPTSIDRHLTTVFLREPIGPGSPPKSRWYIRQILEHIRQLVQFRFRNRAG